MTGVKGLFAVLATITLFIGLSDGFTFMLSWALVVGLREVQKTVVALNEAKQTITEPEEKKPGFEIKKVPAEEQGDYE